MQKKYNAAIIGCGNIAALYDEPQQSDRVLTHAHAYSLEPRANLCAMVDVERHKADEATKKWGGKPYYDAEDMLENEDIDIISICVPDRYHENILDLCLSYKPKAVLCEKPLTLNMASAERIVDEYANAGIYLSVNFSRRFDTSIINLRNAIAQGTYGNVLNAVGIYTKGILHNGSHLIDTFRFLFGDITETIPLSARNDWNDTDLTLDAYIEFYNGAKAHLVGADEGQYSIFDINILCEKARFQLSQFGLKMTAFHVRNDPVYPGCKDLNDGKCNKTGLNTAMLYAISNIIDTIEKKKALICSGADAAITQKICLELLQKYHMSGA
jgi:predicted dehydrogenase